MVTKLYLLILLSTIMICLNFNYLGLRLIAQAVAKLSTSQPYLRDEPYLVINTTYEELIINARIEYETKETFY